jgi:hypothetical protein
MPAPKGSLYWTRPGIDPILSPGGSGTSIKQGAFEKNLLYVPGCEGLFDDLFCDNTAYTLAHKAKPPKTVVRGNNTVITFM